MIVVIMGVNSLSHIYIYFAVTVLMVLILNLGVWSRFLPNDFVEEFVVVENFVEFFTLIFLSCGARNSFVYCGSLRGVRKVGLLVLW